MQVDIYTMPVNEFLSYARLIGRGDMPLQEWVTFRDSVRKRCNELGYAWTQGCCGTHTLTKIDYASKN